MNQTHKTVLCFQGETHELFPPATRSTDPSTSLRAEQKVTESGKRKGLMLQCVELIKDNPGQTAGEIAYQLKIERTEASKRLADARNIKLLENGDPRACLIKGSKMLTWYPSRGPE